MHQVPSDSRYTISFFLSFSFLSCALVQVLFYPFLSFFFNDCPCFWFPRFSVFRYFLFLVSICFYCYFRFFHLLVVLVIFISKMFLFYFVILLFVFLWSFGLGFSYYVGLEPVTAELVSLSQYEEIISTESGCAGFLSE